MDTVSPPTSVCRQDGQCEKVSLTAFKTATSNKFDLECKCVQAAGSPRSWPHREVGLLGLGTCSKDRAAPCLGDR